MPLCSSGISKVNWGRMTHISAAAAEMPLLKEGGWGVIVGVEITSPSVHTRVQAQNHTPSRFIIIIRLLGDAADLRTDEAFRFRRRKRYQFASDGMRGYQQRTSRGLIKQPRVDALMEDTYGQQKPRHSSPHSNSTVDLHALNAAHSARGVGKHRKSITDMDFIPRIKKKTVHVNISPTSCDFTFLGLKITTAHKLFSSTTKSLFYSTKTRYSTKMQHCGRQIPYEQHRITVII